jgi:hypothetical protein
MLPTTTFLEQPFNGSVLSFRMAHLRDLSAKSSANLKTKNPKIKNRACAKMLASPAKTRSL